MRKMKKSISLIMAILMLLTVIPLSASAIVYSGTFGANGCLKWEFDSKTNVLIISGNGAFPDATELVRPLYNKRGYEKVIIKDGVTSVGDFAFKGSGKLVSVELPPSVTSIGEKAFMNCDKLERINLHCIKSLGISAFEGCTALKTIELLSPDLKTIPESAFENCQYLKTIKFAEGLQTIDKRAFFDCYKYYKEIVIPDTVTTIGKNAFYHCGINELTLGKGVTTISGGAFYNNYLNTLTIPASVQTLQGDAAVSYGTFGHNSDLTRIYIEDGALKNEGIRRSDFIYSYEDKYGNSVSALSLHAVYCEGSSLKHNLNDDAAVYYNHSTHSYCTETLTAPTSAKPCLSTVTKTYCTSCGDYYKTTTASSTEHKYTVETLYPADCVTVGHSKMTCSVCGDFKEVMSTNDTHKSLYTTEFAIAATCTSDGRTKGTACSACKKTVTISEVIPALNHKNKRAYNVAATCTKQGYKNAEYCPDCKTIFTNDDTIITEPTNHPNKYNKAKVDATCTSTGTEAGVYCNDCHKWLEGGATISKSDHEFVDWKIIRAADCMTKSDLKEAKCKYCDKTTQQSFSNNNPNHKDENHNGTCDTCNKKLTLLCLCACHKKDGKGTGWFRFCRFFWKLFKTNKYCKCGVTHY